MRLILASSIVNIEPPVFKEIHDSSDPEYRYIILSHRWGHEELTYQEVSDHETFWKKEIDKKQGYKKLLEFARVVHQRYDTIKWIWCDTCCINKNDPAELSEAINSMYRWYKNSKACIAYLADYPSPGVRSFTNSVWFTRCWTLQELIAPSKVMFYDCHWKMIGHKEYFARDIFYKTGIDRSLLKMDRPIEKFSIAQRMSWTKGRTALKKEDETYCLLGIFGVSMPMLYGEGENAFLRLQEQIIQRSPDQSIFVWTSTPPSRNLLASKPADFGSCGGIGQNQRLKCPFSLNNLGLEIELELRPIKNNTYAAYLACEYIQPSNAVSLILEYEPGTSFFYRVQSNYPQQPEQCSRELRKSRKVTILRNVPSTVFTTRPVSDLYGFRLGGGCHSLLLINSYEQTRYWDHGEWRSDSQDPAHQPPTFEIPLGEAPSIATMILFIGELRFLIHLMYDFDFRPCCYVSIYNRSVGPVFYLRRPLSENKMAWLESTSGWTREKTHMYMQMDIPQHPHTEEPGWAAKALHRAGYTARIPKNLTHPYRDVEISFSPHPETGDWTFDVSHEQVGIGQKFLDLGFPIVSGSSELQDVFMQLGDLGFHESMTDYDNESTIPG